MNTAPVPFPARSRVARDWLQGVLGAALVAAVGVLLGTQYFAPDKRVIAAGAAVVVFGIAWRLDMVMGIGMLVLLLPFPRTVVFGSTNLAFILLLLVIWLLRYTTRSAPAPVRTPADVPLVGLLIAYVVSYYNVDASRPDYLRYALQHGFEFASCLLMFYLIVSNVRSTAQLKRLHLFMTVSIVMVLFTAAYELAFPGRPLVSGWIQFSETATEGLASNMRVGGAFFDYELLGEFCGMSLLFVIFLIAQAKSATRKAALFVLLGGTIFILFATVTRGAMVALAAALLYLAVHLRRRLQVVPLTILLGTSLALLFAMEFYVANFTSAGSIFQRFGETHMVNGLPDTRAKVWPMAFERWMIHPLIGWGPYYSSEHGLLQWYWPHCLYLYVPNIVGALGLAFFLWFLAKLWIMSRPTTDWLGHPSYVKGYLLIAHVQFMLFLVDEIKIEYLRNPIYQFVIWVFFSSLVAAHLIDRRESQAAALARPAAAA